MIKELLQNNNEIVFILNDESKNKFLKEAKNEGFMWFTGKPIDEHDMCSYHVVVDKDKIIGNISTMLYLKSYYKNLKTIVHC